MTTHTPGPWQVTQRWPNWHGIEIRAGDTILFDISVRANGHNAEHGKANARLIASAPDLLRALTRLAHDCSNLDNPMVLEKIQHETLPEARQAIAKATGE